MQTEAAAFESDSVRQLSLPLSAIIHTQKTSLLSMHVHVTCTPPAMPKALIRHCNLTSFQQTGHRQEVFVLAASKRSSCCSSLGGETSLGGELCLVGFTCPSINSLNEASVLWRASNFYQADGVKAYCEEYLSQQLTALTQPVTLSSENQDYVPGKRVTGSASSPHALERVTVACFQKVMPCLQIILELCSSYSHGSSDRLVHMLVLWLLPNLHKALGCRDLCAVLYRHRDVMEPALMSHIRDQLVTLVILSDDLVDEVDF
ncbi:hypothetical protein CEUSTIGMA_g5844.t1 [Chlamydomonas eustigma]|uniref:Uncharacterized protein n=1 Tax=Chlamydomonas eustigma TaxID=1157962 RepID=A0A250X683_9CHLO|nr:hypothetical protein CEUSTIGMA_g5844.t1 [Chlamydomonas eustigma]|eukprot:GAX78402.1 hypothetical protein CEUSTIGMA_g5844.t1 [Chlamydomonas eustigma]